LKDSALNNSNSDPPIVPPSPDRLFERDKSSTEAAGDDSDSQPQTIIADTDNKDTSLAIEDSPEKQFTKSDSVPSLKESDKIEIKVLEDSSSSSRSSAEEEEEAAASASLQLLAEARNISSIDESKPFPDCSYMEESQDVFYVTETDGDKTEDLSLSQSPSSPSSPARPNGASSPSPLLTSTPHSLPPVSRSRISSSPLSGQSPGPAREEPQPLSLPPMTREGSKSYDYLLKVLLVGDSDVGKQEILSGLDSGCVDSVYCSSTGAAYKTTTILIDGKRVKLQIWDTSGQGRFCTIIRSYSRGAQGILLVYDITNKWSFEGMDRWVREVEEHAPGIPKVLVGNRLHLAFKRQVDQTEAESYAEKNHMGFYEVSPLVNFNITESFQELSRMALKRNGMERLWRSNKVLSLHELCCHSIVATTNVYNIDKLPLPDSIKANLKSYAMTNNSGLRQALNYKTLKDRKKKSKHPDLSGSKRMNLSRKSCVIS